jgi:hypothetical protein
MLASFFTAVVGAHRRRAAASRNARDDVISLNVTITTART